MIYSNIRINSEEKLFNSGIYNIVKIGKRKIFTMTCPKGTIVNEGENPQLTIFESVDTKPRIDIGKDRDMYMILSAENIGSDNIREFNQGTISILDPADIDILGYGYGSFQDTRHVAWWDAFVLKILGKKVWIRVDRVGRNGPEFYYICKRKVTYFESFGDVRIWCDANNVKIGFDNNIGWMRLGE